MFTSYCRGPLVGTVAPNRQQIGFGIVGPN
jgi:hypothetical protein